MHRDGEPPKVPIERLILVRNSPQSVIALVCGAQVLIQLIRLLLYAALTIEVQERWCC